MTSTRSAAYRRVVLTVRDLGPAKLSPQEQACIREAADALLFCEDLSWDRAAVDAVADVTVLADHLIASDRWTAERAHRLLDDIWGCGPANWDAVAA